MTVCIVRRKEKFDVFFLDENREVQDIYEAEKLEIYNDIDAFERTLAKDYISLERYENE